jgi:aspartyl-tRNA synthetase
VIKCIVAPGCAGLFAQGSGRVDRVSEGAWGEGIGYSGGDRRRLEGNRREVRQAEEAEAVKSKTGAKEGDLILFAADQRAVVNKVLGGLRVIFRDKLETG